MPKVVVKTGTTQDGEFDLDLATFSWRERAYIAEVAPGTTPLNYIERWLALDPKTVIATIAVMMQRAGRRPDLEVLYDAPEESFSIDYSDLAGEEEPDEGPPGSPPPDDAGESVERPASSETSG